MRKIFLMAILVLSLTATAHAKGHQGDPWPYETDKMVHVVWGGATEASISYLGTKAGLPYSPEVGLAAAVATGLIKEYVFDTHPDIWDAAATIGGGLLAYTIDRFWIRATVEKKPGGAILKLSMDF